MGRYFRTVYMKMAWYDNTYIIPLERSSANLYAVSVGAAGHNSSTSTGGAVPEKNIVLLECVIITLSPGPLGMV